MTDRHVPRAARAGRRRVCTGSAPAKAILAGEHFVVHGCPAVAVPVPGLRLEATLAPARLPRSHEGHVAACLAVLRDRFGGPPPQGVDVRIRSSIPIGAGLGSSAALSVALARAWLRLVGREPRDDDVREASLACERLAHGDPSGIDTEVAVTGRAVRFVRGARPAALRVARGVGLVTLDAGPAPPTAAMVAAVAARRAAAPAEFEALATRARAVVARAERALAAGEARELGAAFAEGHELLRRIGVVTGGVERLVRAARDAGAAGAKVTGAGGGGIVIAVQAEAETAAVAERLRAAGVRVVSAGPLGAGLTSRAASPRSRRSRPRPRRRA